MVPANSLDKCHDPVEMLNACLEHAWDKICQAYDATADLPSLPGLFSGADLSSPSQAAQVVLVNMLLEVMECIGRFSPWYTKPARAFGLTSLRGSKTQRTCWLLAPEAIQKWGTVLASLEQAIHKSSGLVQAILLVDGLMARSETEDPCVTASCRCVPPRVIQLKRSVLLKTEIICHLCQQPYA